MTRDGKCPGDEMGEPRDVGAVTYCQATSDLPTGSREGDHLLPDFGWHG